MIFNSIVGGTGSGLGSLLLNKLSEEYEKKTKLGFNVLPYAKLSNSILEPYNEVFALSSLINHMDVSIVLVNTEALWQMCKNKLGIVRPKYLNLNKIIAQ